MKKTYYRPEALLTVIDTERHICNGSPNSGNPTNLDDVTPGGNDPGDFSRRRNVWDDEE